MNNEYFQTVRRANIAGAEITSVLECFGDEIAKREEYTEHRGIDALHFYLVERYHWLPSAVRSLNWDDLQFLFDETQAGWILPKELRGVIHSLASLEAGAGEREPKVART